MPAVRTDKEDTARDSKTKKNSGPPLFPVREKMEDLANCLFS